MGTEISNKAADKIEALCESGCTLINQLLEKASQGNEIEELAEFNLSESKQIIEELKKIMAVYKIDKT